jgi:arylsulfatase A-like enzyme
MPTILDYAGLPIPSQCQGESLRKFVDGREDMDRAAFCEGTHPTGGILRRMVRTQEWKLWIFCQGNPEKPTWPQKRPMELYHISEDPGEEHNLAEDPAYAKVRKEMVDRMISWMKDIKDPWIDKLPKLA